MALSTREWVFLIIIVILLLVLAYTIKTNKKPERKYTKPQHKKEIEIEDLEETEF